MLRTQYNQRVKKERLEIYKKHFEHLTLTKRTVPEPSEAGAGNFNKADLIKVHVLPITNPLQEKFDDFLDISFKEWEQWLNDYEIRSAQLRHKYHHPYTPIEFREDDYMSDYHPRRVRKLPL